MSGGTKISGASFLNTFSLDGQIQKFREEVEQNYIRPSVCYIKRAWPTVQDLAHKASSIALGIILALSIYIPQLGMALFIGGGSAHLSMRLRVLNQSIQCLERFADEIEKDDPEKPPTWDEVLSKIKRICSEGDGAFDVYLFATELPKELQEDPLLQPFNDCYLDVPALTPIIVAGKIYDAEFAAYHYIIHKKYPWPEPIKPEINRQAYFSVRACLDSKKLRKQIVAKIRQLSEAYRSFSSITHFVKG